MKSWWDYYPVMILAILLPFIPGLLPTLTFGSNVLGGGPIRQFAINTVANHLPVNAGQQYINAFNSASVSQEIVLYLPIALNLSAILAVVVFVLFSWLIQINNWTKRSEFQSHRQASKG